MDYTTFFSFVLLLFMLTDKFVLFMFTPIERQLSSFGMLLFAIFCTVIYSPSAFYHLKKNRYFIITMFIYIIYTIYPILFCPFQYNPELSIKGSIYFSIKVLLVMAIMVTIISNNKFNLERENVIIGFAVFTAVCSLLYLILRNIGIHSVLFSWVVDGSIQPNFYMLSHHHEDGRLMYFFSEPSKYAIFLVLPIFLSLTLKQLTGLKKYSIYSFLLIIVLILTQSFAIIFSVIISIIVSRIAKSNNIIKKVFLSCALIFLCICAGYVTVMVLAKNAFTITSAFNKYHSYNDRLTELYQASEIANRYPYGIGLSMWGDYRISLTKYEFGSNDDGSLPGITNVIIEDFIRGGYVYLALRGIFFIVFLVLFYKSCRKNNPLLENLAISSLSILLGSLLYGPLEQRVFLVSFIMLTVQYSRIKSHAFNQNHPKAECLSS
jgi:hypothetical protein